MSRIYATEISYRNGADIFCNNFTSKDDAIQNLKNSISCLSWFDLRRVELAEVVEYEYDEDNCTFELIDLAYEGIHLVDEEVSRR